MFDRAIVLHPGEVDGKLDIGRIIEAMLYYSHIDFVVDGPSFAELWFKLGSTGMRDLLTHSSLSVQITPEMRGVENVTRNFVRTHRPITFTTTGSGGVTFDPSDTARAMHVRINNREATPLSDVRKLARLFPVTSFAKIIRQSHSKGDLFESIISDSASMRIFLDAYAKTKGLKVNYEALSGLHVLSTKIEDSFFIANSIDLQMVIPGCEIDGWDDILPFVNDYTYDLRLSQARSADVIASDLNSYIASGRIDLSIKRALQVDAEKSSFEELVFDEARAFREAFNAGQLSLNDALRVIDKTAKFREWLSSLPPDAHLIKEYHRAVTRETILGTLPSKIARFAAFTGSGIALDHLLGAGGAGTAVGVALSAVDNFVVDGIFRGWRPNHFVAEVNSALNRK